MMGFREKMVLGFCRTWYKMLSGFSRDAQNLLGFLGKERGCREGRDQGGLGENTQGKIEGKGDKSSFPGCGGKEGGSQLG